MDGGGVVAVLLQSGHEADLLAVVELPAGGIDIISVPKETSEGGRP